MKHVRVIVTENGACVDVARVILGATASDVDARTRECLQQVIDSLLGPSEPIPDIDQIMAHGGWWNDTGSQPVSVLVLTPQSFVPDRIPSVSISIKSGCVINTTSDSPVYLRVTDYDTEGVSGDRLSVDSYGRPCLIESTYLPAAIDRQPEAWPRVLEHLTDSIQQGFVILTATTNHLSEPEFEAWSYHGPLDFDKATPACFGTGPDLLAALESLDYRLRESVAD
jgi:hypothetical protein